jgi:hypothetical protein
MYILLCIDIGVDVFLKVLWKNKTIEKKDVSLLWMMNMNIGG